MFVFSLARRSSVLTRFRRFGHVVLYICRLEYTSLRIINRFDRKSPFENRSRLELLLDCSSSSRTFD